MSHPISTEDYYEYHESKDELKRGQITDYFECLTCEHKKENSEMSKEYMVCQECYDKRGQDETE